MPNPATEATAPTTEAGRRLLEAFLLDGGLWVEPLAVILAIEQEAASGAAPRMRRWRDALLDIAENMAHSDRHGQAPERFDWCGACLARDVLGLEPLHVQTDSRP